jgi:5,10-methylenetetrahydromethanopterin reductase
MLYQPAWLPLLEIARATRRVRIGVAAVNPFTCHPINIAGNIALIDEASSGRAYLGFARGAWLDFVGLQPTHAPQALAESMRCVRHLLRGDPSPLPGDYFPLTGGDSLRWSAIRPDIPFLLGSWGMQTLSTCAGLFSELKIGGSANPDLVDTFLAALRNTGGPADKIGLVFGAVSVVDVDREAARALARREVALYLPVVAALDRTLQLEPDLLTRLTESAARYDFDSAAALISDDLLDRFAFAGTPVDLAEQALRLFSAGAQRVEFGTPHGLDQRSGLRLLCEEVLPRIRAEYDPG